MKYKVIINPIPYILLTCWGKLDYLIINDEGQYLYSSELAKDTDNKFGYNFVWKNFPFKLEDCTIINVDDKLNYEKKNNDNYSSIYDLQFIKDLLYCVRVYNYKKIILNKE